MDKQSALKQVEESSSSAQVGTAVTTRRAPSPSNSNVEEIQGQDRLIATLKAEVDALQIAQAEKRRPWYLEISTLLSVVALALSLATTFIAEDRARSQTIQDTRVDLRQIIQRLSSLPREALEAGKTFGDDPMMVVAVRSMLNQENALLAKQGAELIRKLPQEHVTATEFYAIAMALQGTYDVRGAKDLLIRGQAVAKDFNDRLAILRAMANLHFIVGEPSAGRKAFQEALEIFEIDGFKGVDPYTKASTTIWTEIAWGSAEFNTGLPDDALKHADRADAVVASMRPGPGADDLRAQIAKFRSDITNHSVAKGALNAPPH